jgi:hypothetical protein
LNVWSQSLTLCSTTTPASRINASTPASSQNSGSTAPGDGDSHASADVPSGGARGDAAGDALPLPTLSLTLLAAGLALRPARGLRARTRERIRNV